MKFRKGDLIYLLLHLVVVILAIWLIAYLYNKVYEYHCDHIPINEAFKDTKCKNYFYESTED